jgi:hypothetical protein
MPPSPAQMVKEECRALAGVMDRFGVSKEAYTALRKVNEAFHDEGTMPPAHRLFRCFSSFFLLCFLFIHSCPHVFMHILFATTLSEESPTCKMILRRRWGLPKRSFPVRWWHTSRRQRS